MDFTVLMISLVLNGLLVIWIVFSLVQSRQMKNIFTILSQNFTILTDCFRELSVGNLVKQVALRHLDYKLPTTRKKSLVGTLAEFSDDLVVLGSEFNSMTGEPLRRFLYVGPDSYVEGKKCAIAMGESLGGKGQILVVVLNRSSIVFELRRKGFTYQLQEEYPLMQVCKVLETGREADQVVKLVQAELEANPAITGVYVTAGLLPKPAAEAIAKAKKTGKISMIGHDISPATAELIANGEMYGALNQDAYAQGFNSVMHLVNHMVAGWRPPSSRMLSNLVMTTRENLSRYWTPQTGLIETDDTPGRLAAPIKVAVERLRVAVVGDERSVLWLQVKAGITAVSQVLRSYNVEVSWCIPERYKMTGSKDLTAVELGEWIEELGGQSYDAIVTPVVFKETVPYLNRVIAKGVMMATYNKEPINLRTLIEWLSVNSKEFIHISTQFTQGYDESRIAISEITNSIQAVSHSAEKQLSITQSGSEALRELTHMLQSVEDSSEKQMKSTGKADALANSMGDVAAALLARMDQLLSVKRRLDLASSNIRQLEDFSKRMVEIITRIEGISHDTHMLALNASIQAAHAGESGKGFGVVANEIKKLADYSSASAGQISELINGLQHGVTSTIGPLVESTKEIDDQIENISESSNSIAELTKELRLAMDQVTVLVSDNISAAHVIRSSSQEVEQTMQTVLDFSNQNTKLAEDVSSATIEIERQTEQMAQMAKTLSLISEVLQGSVMQFNTSTSMD